MCDQCNKLEEKLSHYHRFLTNRFDPLTEERIKALIAELKRQKAALHPEPNALPRAVSWPRPH
jgi:hypothetical protein